jgi:uncharacterized membrane protein
MKSKLIQHWRLPPTWLRFLIIVLLALGVFFRFVNLEQKVYWHDETLTSLRISGYTQTEVIGQVFNGNEINSRDLQKYQQLNPEKGIIDTLYALATEAPNHPPLYYLILRFWVQIFGSSTAVTRSCSALISLLMFPCIYWLCLELFESPLVGWVSIVLIAVSPFHVLYAQEAREYSLWTVSILLSSASLLRAMRVQTKQSWIIYASTLVLGFYTHLWFGLVAIGHGVYVTGSRLNDINLKTFRLPRVLTNYLIAIFFALIAFIPWILIIIINFSNLYAAIGWINNPTPSFRYLIKTWIVQFSSVFFDPSSNVFFNLNYQLDNSLAYLIRLPVLILSGYSIYILCRHTTKSVWLFILALIGVTGLVLMLPDALLRLPVSSVSRYLIPCYLGVELAVAYLITTKITVISLKIWQQKLWYLIMNTLIALGIFSCILSSQAEVWWNKYSGIYNLQVAHIVNQATHPLLISSSSGGTVGNLLSLSYLLEPKVQMQLAVEPNQLRIKSGFSDVFLYSPSQSFRAEFEKEQKSKLQAVYRLREFRELWRLEN